MWGIKKPVTVGTVIVLCLVAAVFFWPDEQSKQVRNQLEYFYTNALDGILYNLTTEYGPINVSSSACSSGLAPNCSFSGVALIGNQPTQFQEDTALNSTGVSQINASDNIRYVAAGDVANNPFLRTNFTLPTSSRVNWVLINSEMGNTLGLGMKRLALWNYTSSAFEDVVLNDTATSDTNMTFNVSGTNITAYLGNLNTTIQVVSRINLAGTETLLVDKVMVTADVEPLIPASNNDTYQNTTLYNNRVVPFVKNSNISIGLIINDTDGDLTTTNLTIGDKTYNSVYNQSNLTGFFPFNEMSGTTSQNRYANVYGMKNITLIGGYNWDSGTNCTYNNVQYGGCVRFDGSTGLGYINATNYLTNSTFTAYMTVKLGTPITQMRILSTERSSKDGFSLLWTGNTFQFITRNGAGLSTNIQSSANIRNDTTYKIIIKYDGNFKNASMRVNRTVSTQSNVVMTLNETTNLTIASNSGGGNKANITVDELYIFNRTTGFNEDMAYWQSSFGGGQFNVIYQIADSQTGSRLFTNISNNNFQQGNYSYYWNSSDSFNSLTSGDNGYLMITGQPFLNYTSFEVNTTTAGRVNTPYVLPFGMSLAEINFTFQDQSVSSASGYAAFESDMNRNTKYFNFFQVKSGGNLDSSGLTPINPEINKGIWNVSNFTKRWNDEHPNGPMIKMLIRLPLNLASTDYNNALYQENTASLCYNLTHASNLVGMGNNSILYSYDGCIMDPAPNIDGDFSGNVSFIRLLQRLYINGFQNTSSSNYTILGADSQPYEDPGSGCCRWNSTYITNISFYTNFVKLAVWDQSFSNQANYWSLLYNGIKMSGEIATATGKLMLIGCPMYFSDGTLHDSNVENIQNCMTGITNASWNNGTAGYSSNVGYNTSGIMLFLDRSPKNQNTSFGDSTYELFNQNIVFRNTDNVTIKANMTYARTVNISIQNSSGSWLFRNLSMYFNPLTNDWEINSTSMNFPNTSIVQNQYMTLQIYSQSNGAPDFIKTITNMYVSSPSRTTPIITLSNGTGVSINNLNLGAYWRFENITQFPNGNRTFDSSGNNISLNVSTGIFGNVQWPTLVSGAVMRAYSTGIGPVLNSTFGHSVIDNIFSNGGTVVFWTDFSVGATSKGQINKVGWWVVAGRDPDFIEFNTRGANGDRGTWTANVDGINGWHQIIIVYNSTAGTTASPQIFLDGINWSVSVTDAPTATALDDSEYEFSVMEGDVDEMMLWTKSLNITEIDMLSGRGQIPAGSASNYVLAESNVNDGDVTYNFYRSGANASSPDATVLPAGTYYYLANTSGGASYNQTSLLTFLTVIASVPTFSDNHTYQGNTVLVIEDDNSITYNLTSNISFDVLPADDISIDKCLLQFGGVNYTMNYTGGNVSVRKVGQRCVANMTSQAGGTYSNVRMYFNDSNNNFNATGPLTLTISNASLSGTTFKFIDGLPRNKTITNGTFVTISANTTLTGADLPVLNLYDNNNLTNSSASGSVSFTFAPSFGVAHQIIINSSGNANYSTFSNASIYIIVSKGDNNLTLYVSPSNIVVPGTTTNVTGTETAGVGLTLTRDGTTVSNPFIGVLAEGTYLFTLSSPSTFNISANSVSAVVTVTSQGLGCTTPTTFGYRANVTKNGTLTALDFTDEVNQKIVKQDFTDIYLNLTAGPNVTGARNVTGGNYYFVVNSSNVTWFVVEYANYIGSQQWSNTTNNTNVTQFNGTQVKPVYTFTMAEETTSVVQLPPHSNRTMTIYCDSGIRSFAVNDTRITVATVEQPNDFRMKIDYGPDQSYNRHLIPASSFESRTFYLVDAEVNQLAQVVLELDDRTLLNEFSENSTILRIKKILHDGLQSITENRFDVTGKIAVFLIPNDDYSLQLDNGAEVRSLGNLDVDTTDLDKTIVVTDQDQFDFNDGNVSWRLNMSSTGLIVFRWSDNSSNTQAVNFTVYNYSSGAILFDGYGASNDVTFAYQTPNANQTYRAKWHVSSLTYGLNSAGGEHIFTGVAAALLPFLPGIINPTYINVGAMIFLIFVAGLFGARQAHVGVIVVVVLAATFAAIGLMTFGSGAIETKVVPGIIAFLAFFAVVGAIVHKRRSESE